MAEALAIPEALTLEKNQVEESVGTTEALEEYAALAERAGFSAEDITLYRLRAFIRETGLRVYPLEEVDAFLDKKFGGPKADRCWAGPTRSGAWKHTTEYKWGWYPLRQADLRVVNREIGTEYTWEWERKRKNDDSGMYSKIVESRRVLATVYNRLIPFPVLSTVAEISARFPSVSFIVADRAEYETTTIVPSSRPQDPFLAVLGPGIPVMVIERWDEPNFRGGTTSPV